MPAAYRLQIDEPGEASRVVVIDRGVDVGRDCDGIVLLDPTASRRHVRLEPTDEGVVATDLGSSNGTIAGGELMTEPIVLGVGAWLKVGETRIVVHPGRQGDQHAVGEHPADAERHAAAGDGERTSEGVRQLGQAGAHTQRPGGPVTRPPR